MSTHRPSSLYASQSQSQSTTNSTTTALQSRITQKRLELDNLRQLRDLSSQLDTQMSTLEEKLSTLRDGTEAVSEVLKNWTNVLSVLGMVGKELPKIVASGDEDKAVLPGTLVRVPVEQRLAVDGAEEGKG